MTYSRRITNTKSKVLATDYMNYVIHNPVESMWKKYINKWLKKHISIVYRLRSYVLIKVEGLGAYKCYFL